MTLTQRKQQASTTKLSSIPPFAKVALRLNNSVSRPRLMEETMVRRHEKKDDDEPQNDTMAYEEEQSSYVVTPPRWNRTRTLSGGLPERKIAEEDDVDDDIAATTEWNFDPMTPPRTLARVYAASAPRQRKQQQQPLTQQRCRSLSPSSSPRRLLLERADAWLIPHQHPLKVLWDVCTVLLSIANAYATHMAIRDREFQNPFIRFCEIWFVLDILLNFCVQRTTNDGTVLRTFRAVWARYLTSWFVVDVLSLFPAELLYVQPVVEAQKRRTIWQKGFFRTKAVVKVLTRWLRLYHVRYLARVSQHTKRAAGIGAARLVRLLIRYAPKYIMFIRKTRGVLWLRALRQVRWLKNLYIDLCCSDGKVSDAATCNLTEDDNNMHTGDVADWEVLDEDDGDPF